MRAVLYECRSARDVLPARQLHTGNVRGRVARCRRFMSSPFRLVAAQSASMRRSHCLDSSQSQFFQLSREPSASSRPMPL